MLRLVEGQPFRVESKHLAGFMVFSALARVDIEHAVGTSYRLQTARSPKGPLIVWRLVSLAWIKTACSDDLVEACRDVLAVTPAASTPGHVYLALSRCR